jgi:S1-C subfamily serine protease
MTLKTIFGNIISGLFGAGICLWVYTVFLQPKKEHQQQKSKFVSEKIESNLRTLTNGPDFTSAAEKSTPAVVHIFAEESQAQLQRRIDENQRKRPRSLFEDFWGNDFGSDFFGRSFYRQKNGSGSGVVYTKDGYIITNNHVVGFADNIEVTFADGKKYKAKKIGTDPRTDLAVIKVEGDNFKTMDVADSDKIRIGEWVLAVGNPFDYLTSTVTAGIVSAKGRDLGLIENEKSIEEFIQTDAVINPGNSGGALVTSDGQLLGITTAIATPTGVYAGYSFAIPSNLMKNIVSRIIEIGGDIEDINLGIGGYDVDKELIDELSLNVKAGFYVEELDVKSPAKLAGVLPGDVIIKINNSPIRNFEDIGNSLKSTKKGDIVTIHVNRNGKDVSIPTKLR